MVGFLKSQPSTLLARHLSHLGGITQKKFTPRVATNKNHSHCAPFGASFSAIRRGAQQTHRSLFDGSLQGLARTDRPAFSFQGHPEASPGPHDVAPLFDRFIDLMAANRPDA